MRIPWASTRWPTWLVGWIFIGLAIAASEWALLASPGARGTTAAVAGVVAGGLGFHLIRGGRWRFGGLSAMSTGGLAGIKSGSALLAIASGLLLALMEAGIYRLIDRHAARGGRAGGEAQRP